MNTKFIIVMGVSGSGKTTIGNALAQRLKWDFYDANSFHPAENITKMANGIPLNDDDRRPWLNSLHDLITSCIKKKHPGVLACSALKERYRQTLVENNQDVQIVYLKGDYELISSRMGTRTGHYMKSQMLRSQFTELEEPTNALVMDVSIPFDEIVGKIIKTIV
jgi:gluconokinase